MLSVIILAGGRGSRMGGVDKAQITLDGVRLIDILVDELSESEVIVVSPYLRSDSLQIISENPPFGGPVAGIAAGAAALRGTDLVAVISVDAPDSPRMLPLLINAVSTAPEADVAVVRAADGYMQPLCAVWRAESLHRALSQLDTVRDRAAKALLAEAKTVIEIPGDGTERDYDTLAELAQRGRAEIPEDLHGR